MAAITSPPTWFDEECGVVIRGYVSTGRHRVVRTVKERRGNT